MREDIVNSKTIPALMEALQSTYDIEVPDIDSESPIARLWKTPVSVIEETAPEPRYTATGSISDEFPFTLIKIVPQPDVEAIAKITVFETAPPEVNARGIKATVFRVPISPAHPNGVIVKRGLTFIEQEGALVPEESVIPSEAQKELDRKN